MTAMDRIAATRAEIEAEQAARDKVIKAEMAAAKARSALEPLEDAARQRREAEEQAADERRRAEFPGRNRELQDAEWKARRAFEAAVLAGDMSRAAREFAAWRQAMAERNGLAEANGGEYPHHDVPRFSAEVDRVFGQLPSVIRPDEDLP